MSVLVSGGTGFIGSHTCVELLKSGEDVIVFDNLVNSKRETAEKVENITGGKIKFYLADMRDEKALEKIFSENEIESLIHFAGLKAVGESVRMPLEYFENNITGTLKLLRACREHGCKKLVFSSSATVYGMGNTSPMTEGMPLSVTNPYGRTKLMIEDMLRDIAASDKEWSIMLLRYFNPIGAHESGLIGENPNGIPNNLLPNVVNAAVGKTKELTVFGDDYDTPDGTCIRDYIHVADLARGHISALEWVRKNSGIDAVNLGTGNGYSVLEVISAFEKASGVKVPYRIVGRREGDLAVCFSDPSKAERVLGWKAEFGMDKMCEDLWNFAKKHI